MFGGAISDTNFADFADWRVESPKGVSRTHPKKHPATKQVAQFGYNNFRARIP
jgi:hypothetical protein